MSQDHRRLEAASAEADARATSVTARGLTEAGCAGAVAPDLKCAGVQPLVAGTFSLRRG